AISSFTIDDDTNDFGDDDSNGDGDKIIEQGETIRLPVVLVNNGTAPALDVMATLRTNHADITIIDSTESYESIGDGKTKSPVGFGSGFEFQVANAAISGEVSFEVEINTGNAGTFTETLQVSIVGGGTVGPIAISSFTIDDDTNDFGDDESNGDGDKIIEPGETIRLPVVLVNDGTAPALDVMATLRTNQSDITMIDSTESYESIGDGKTKSAVGFGSGFEFQVANAADTGNVTFDLEITTSNGGIFNDTLSIFIASGGIVGPIEIASFTIDDDTDDFGDDDSNGDDDGVIEQGETIRLPIVLVNNGTASALDVTATLSTTHPDIILKDSTESYESIGEGNSKSPSGFRGGFEFEVANETESSRAFFDLEIQTSNGGAFSDTLSVAIKGGGIVGPIAVATFSIDDDTDNFGDDKSDGDGDGVIEQGETIRLPVLLINNGTAPALNVKATLQSNDPNVAFIDSTELYESIGDGQSKKPEAFANSGGFEFKIASIAENGEIHFDLRITTKDNIVFSDQITLMIGQPSDLSPPRISFNSPLAKIPAPINNFNISVNFSDGLNGSGLNLTTIQIINDRDIQRTKGGSPIKAGENLAQYFSVTETEATFLVPDSLEFPIGKNTLRATIRDRVGNTSEPAAVTFFVDIFGVTSLVSGDFVNSSPVAVSGFAISPFVQRVEVNGSDTPIINNSFSSNVALNQGQNEIYVSAFDSQNSTVRADTILVFLDTNAPVLNITSPVFNQIFNYSPIAVRGTVTDENQVAVYVNEQPVDLENGAFEVEVDIDEGENMVVVKAVDNAGNVLSVPLKVFGRAPDSPAGRLRLFLKEQPVLSQLPLPPYSPGTTGGDWDVPTTRWAYRLNGDISGDTYKFSLLVGCLGLGTAEMVATLALRHNGEDFVLATSDTIIGQIAGFIPSGPFLYYFSPQRRTQTIKGIDAAAVAGDSLIFTVRQIGGNRIGEVWQGEAGGGFSYIEIPDIAVSVSNRKANIPDKFDLAQNYPNPFNPETTIKYQIPKAENVKLEIYNIIGQKVATLVDKKQPAGFYSYTWDSKNDAGIQVASGIYLYRLQAGEFVKTHKLTLLR
ncbi:MAG: FlgD immunoglobulin-like domain containing protein, partial [bacterium]